MDPSLLTRAPDSPTPEAQLLRAISQGSPGELAAALARNPNLDIHDESGHTPLGLAVTCDGSTGGSALVKMLLAQNPNLNFANAHGQTALHIALSIFDSAMALRLLQAGGSPDARDNAGQTCLLKLAGTWGFSSEVHIAMAELSSDLNHQGPAGAALHQCAMWPDKLLLASLLLERGANVDPLTEDCFTPLHVAATNRAPALVELFLQNGADIEARQCHGMTPLMLAAESGSLESIGILIRRGADLFAKDFDGQTAFDHAKAAGHAKSLAALRAEEAKLLAKELALATNPSPAAAAAAPRI